MKHTTHFPGLISGLVLALAGSAFAQSPSFWDRESDWVDQLPVHAGTTIGNPASDSLGNPCYEYSYTLGGGGLGSADPWYDRPRDLMVWDDAWFGGQGAWAVADDTGCAARRGWFTHSGQLPGRMPVVTWQNPRLSSAELLITGTVTVVWTGDFGIAQDVPVDLVVGIRDSATAPTTLLTSMTLTKPTPDSSTESVHVEVLLPGVFAGADSEVFWSIRADGLANGHWVSLVDRHLNFVPYAPGTEYCEPTALNSRGIRAEMLVGGSSDVVDNDVTLRATGMPFHQFGMFLCSRDPALIPNPGGSLGNLCLGGQIGRYKHDLFFTEFGEGDLHIDLSTMPTPNGTASVQTGDTWYFQAWYREVGGNSHFTSAVEVTFL